MEEKDVSLLDSKNTRCFADCGFGHCAVLEVKSKTGCNRIMCSFYKTRMEFIDGFYKAKANNLVRGVPEYPPAEYGGDALEFYQKIWKKVDNGEVIKKKNIL